MKNLSQEILKNAAKFAQEEQIPLIRQINSIAHPNAIRLWLWELPYEVDDKILEIIKNPKEEYFRYAPNAWIIPLRRSVALNYWNEYNEENVVITIWVQEAMFIVLSILKKLWAKKILIPEIYFWIYKKIPSELWLEIETFALDSHFKPNFENLENKLNSFNPEIIIINSPCNPTWTIYSKEDNKKLAEIFLKNRNPIVISDEIYNKLTFNEEFETFFNYYENTIVVDWISKSWASAGLRVWWIFNWNKDLSKLFIWIWTTIKSSTPTLNQYAAMPIVNWETKNSIDSYKEKLKINSLVVEKYLNELWIVFNSSQWWFYMFPDIKDFVWDDSEDFCRFAAKNENWVVVIPWKAFWKPTNVRISFASDKIEEWMKRFSMLLSEFKTKR
ncbi:MAG: hypothetical protein ACD_4C00306G0005 [uncultured bacterium (gcode 4)]|uniref:Aminotransferase class I/classII large domain-containing protein n=1 Tax=uncultured bacterium (gcode 4) TaxID=1234023 RepID=K2G8D8_9BACT|nr:MAG: hypothetical protein ACD_4C00306G0005 [uncultured bacterium (gcode 4)]